MWKSLLSVTALAFVLVVAGMTVQSASAETREFYQAPKLIDDGEYKDYKLTTNSNIIKLETANSGSLIFDKTTCTYSIYDNGIITNVTDAKIKNVSYLVKGKAAGSSTWANVNTVNNAACVATVEPLKNAVFIRGTKTNTVGIFQIELKYVSGEGIKNTMRAYNNNPSWNNHNIGFTESFEVPRIITFANQTRDLADYADQKFNRNWIIANKHKLVELSNSIQYDPSIGIANLEAITVRWDGTTAKLELDYLYPKQIVPFGTWFEVDPTFNFNTNGVANVCNIEPGQDRCGQLITDAAPRNNYLNSVYFWIGATGAPTGNAYVELRRTSVDTVVAQSSTLNTATVSGTAAYLFTFNSSAVIPNENFRIVLYCPTCTGANKINLFGSAGDTAANQQLTYYTGVWNNVVSDARGNMTYSTFSTPDSVTSLTTTEILDTSVTLSWSTPNLRGGTLQGYGINYTTPWGAPLTRIINSTGSAATTYDVTGLAVSTDYSFRVQPWTNGGTNITSARILNVTTLAFVPANFTIGSLNFNATNQNIFPIRFEQHNLNDTVATVQVIFDTDFDMDCTFTYRNAQTSRTYNSISETAYSADESYHNFTLRNPNNDVTQIECVDQNSNQTGTFILNQSNFPLLQQIENFRNGTYGTQGMFGALDFITVAIIIFSTVAFSRINGAMGVLINISLLMALQYFEIIQIPAMIIGVIAVVIITVVGATRKD